MIDHHPATEDNLDRRLALLEQTVAHHRELAEQHTTAADKALTIALAGLNEMRGMASDQSSRFLTRNEYEAKHSELGARIDQLKEDVTLGKGALKGWQILAASLIVPAITIASLLLLRHN